MQLIHRDWLTRKKLCRTRTQMANMYGMADRLSRGWCCSFSDLSVFAPFLIGGVTLSGLGKLSPRFHLLERRLWIVSVLPMVRQIVFCFGAKKMVLLYKENS